MVRVLVVDDSTFMRKSLTHLLESDSSVEVVGTAGDGREAIAMVKQVRPDVVLLDIEMPVMDGFTALAHIMAECPTPVLVLSALNKREATVAIRSLEHGAVDFIPKPSGVISYDISKLQDEIITKVKIASEVRVQKRDFFRPEETFQRPRPRRGGGERVVVIGASTGGPIAIPKVLSGLPRDMPAALVVVQHMHPAFVPTFVERLQWGCSLNVSIAGNGEIVRPGQVLVAPGNGQLAIGEDGDAKTVRLGKRSSRAATLPAIDHAMESAARTYGNGSLGVLLTGIGSDGARGLKAIKEAGGSTIAEDQSSCVVFGMPRAAIQLGCVDKVVPLPMIARTILGMI